MKLSTFPAVLLAAACALGLAACGDSPAAAPSAGPRSTADTGVASAPTPLEPSVVQAAEKEGTVLLYTSADEQLMKPVRAAFKTAYPGIDLRVLDLSDAQIFQRYATEKATGAHTADLVMNSDSLGMLDFVARGNVENYTDPNVKNLPKYAQLAPGVVAMSMDPLVAVYNSALLPKEKQPEDLTGLAALSGSLKGKIGTTDIGNAVQLAAMGSYIAKWGDAGWKNIDTIGPNAGVESGTGNLMQKLVQGEYAATYFVPGTVRTLIQGDAAKIINFTYLKDSTPLIPRAIAVTAGAKSPNAAKVFVNFLLSVEGQEAACKGGFTPYRDGVRCPYGVTAITEAVGADNVIIAGYGSDLAGEKDAIVAHWKRAFSR